MRMLLIGLLIFPTTSFGQVVGQYESLDESGEKLIARSTWVLERGGDKSLITQILKPMVDGSFMYLSALQPAETRAYDARFCEGRGDPPSDTSTAIWGPDVIHGTSCSKTYDSREEMEADELLRGREGSDPKADAGTDIAIDSLAGGYAHIAAPDNYPAEAGKNSFHIARGRFLTERAGILDVHVWVDDRQCHTFKSDPIEAGRLGNVEIGVACFLADRGTVRTEALLNAAGIVARDFGRVIAF